MSVISIFFSQEVDIIGSYCSTFFDGSKVDCEKAEDKFSLYLNQTDKNIYEGKFTSNSFDGTGILKIDYDQENDVLIFKVLSGTGEYYLPKEAIFKR